jgi:hypothetical protein
MSLYRFYLDTSAGVLNVSTDVEGIAKDLTGYFEPSLEWGWGHRDGAVTHIQLSLEPELDLSQEFDGTEEMVRLLGDEKKPEFLVMGKKRVKGKQREFFIPAHAPDVKVVVQYERIIVLGNFADRIARVSRRFIREQLVARLWERDGKLCLHAGATAFRDHGVLILGSDGSGKTTTVLHLLAYQGHDLLSGGRTFVSLTEEGVILHGSVAPVNIDIRSLQTYTQLRDVSVFPFPSSPGSSRKALVERSVLVKAFRCAFVPSCRVSLVILPAVDDSQAALRIEAMPWRVCGPILENSVLTHRDAFHPNWLDVVPNSPGRPTKQIESIISKLDEFEVPCLAISGSFEALAQFLKEAGCEGVFSGRLECASSASNTGKVKSGIFK